MLNENDVFIIHTRRDKNYIRATHRPTGVSVQVEGEGYFHTKNAAMELLEKEVVRKAL